MQIKSRIAAPGSHRFELCYKSSGGAGAPHAQGQGFRSLQELPAVEWAHRAAYIAQRHYACAGDERCLVDILGVVHAAIRGIRPGGQRRALGMIQSWEMSPIHNQPADSGAVATDASGRRVYYDICAVLDRPQQHRGENTTSAMPWSWATWASFSKSGTFSRKGSPSIRERPLWFAPISPAIPSLSARRCRAMGWQAE